MMTKAALDYLREGFSVLPIEPSTKRPSTKWIKLQHSLMTEDEARRLWSTKYHRSIAIVCGAVSSNLFVLDIDDPSLAQTLSTRFDGKTRLVRTPSGGLHVYAFTEAPGHSGPLVAGVADTKAEGGYVLAPPSEGYELVSDAPIVKIPGDGRDWAIATLAECGVTAVESPRPEAPRRVLEAGEIRSGERNDSLFRLACLLRRYGASEGVLYWGLKGINEGLCTPPLSEDEVRELARKAGRYEATFPEVLSAPGNCADHTRRGDDGRIWIPFSDIEPLETQWLWRPRIAKRTITLLAGEPGTAKTWILLYLAAAVSRGAAWPFSDDSAPLGTVLILNAEDDPAMTIRPRLDALSADITKVRILRGSFDLGHDLRIIEEGVLRHPDTQLVIVDPLFSFTGNIDVNAPARTRALLHPLSNLAAKGGFAVILNMHLNKKEELSGLNRIMASKDLPALARSILMTAEDRQTRHVYHLFHVKLNLDEPRANTLTLTFEDRRLKWLQQSNLKVDDFVCGHVQGHPSSPGKLEEAIAFLQESLRGGRRMQSEIASLARQKGISSSTLWRAKESLNIASRKMGGAWYWWLFDSEINGKGGDECD